MTEQQFPHAQYPTYAPAGTQAGPPGPPWQQPPAPAPKKRSWFARHKILTGLGALVALFVIIGVASGGSSSSGSSASAARSGGSSAAGRTAGNAAGGKTTGDNTAAKTPGIGTPARDGKFEFTVTKMRCGVPSVGPEGLEQAAQGQFCLVTLTVTNIGDGARTLDASSQYGYDARGRKLNADTAAGIYANPAGGGAFLNDINPGNSATAIVVFDIPKDGALSKLELHDSPFSGGVDVTVK
jgi:Domain of unknown function (DUF4352)